MEAGVVAGVVAIDSNARVHSKTKKNKRCGAPAILIHPQQGCLWFGFGLRLRKLSDFVGVRVRLNSK